MNRTSKELFWKTTSILATNQFKFFTRKKNGIVKIGLGGWIYDLIRDLKHIPPCCLKRVNSKRAYDYKSVDIIL